MPNLVERSESLTRATDPARPNPPAGQCPTPLREMAIAQGLAIFFTEETKQKSY